MAVSGRLVTADELFRMPDGGSRHELVRGELHTMSPAGFEHGAIIMNIASPLAAHVRAHALGVVCGAETGFMLASDPDTVMAPDVAYVRRERMPSSGRPRGFWRGAPDLAVEVLSPTDAPREVEDKARAWIEAGARLVVLVDPRSRTVAVHRPNGPRSALSGSDVLEGEDVVPGFRLAVADIFAE